MLLNNKKKKRSLRWSDVRMIYHVFSAILVLFASYSIIYLIILYKFMSHYQETLVHKGISNSIEKDSAIYVSNILDNIVI